MFFTEMSEFLRFFELKALDLLYKITKNHPLWRKFALYLLSFLEKLAIIDANFFNTQNYADFTLETLIIILSGKDFSENTPFSEKTIEKPAENPNEKTENDEKIEEKLEKPIESQEIQIKSLCLKLLRIVADEKSLLFFQKKLEEKSLEFKENPKFDVSLEFYLSFFCYICLIPEFFDSLLLSKTPIFFVELAQELIKKKDFIGNSSFLSLIIEFLLNFSGFSLIDKNAEICDKFEKLAIERFLLYFLYEIVIKNDEPAQILLALNAEEKILTKCLENHKKGEKNKGFYFEEFEQKKFVYGLIDAVINNMKKYPDFEKIQIAGFFLI